MDDETVGSSSFFSVTELSVALVREFLHRGGHGDALRAFDASLTSSSSRDGNGSGSSAPTSRSALRRALSLEKHAARAKARSENGSTPTSLEVLVGTHMQRIEQKHQHQAPMTMKTTTTTTTNAPSFTRTHAGGDMSVSDLHAALPPVRASAEFETLKSSASLDATNSSSSSRRSQRPQTAHNLGRSRSADVVVVEDFDEDFEMGPVSTPQIDFLAKRRVQMGESVHHEMWRQAVRLLSRSSAGLGGGAGMESAAACVPDSWLQGFYFRPSPNSTKRASAHEMSTSSSMQNPTRLPYGLVQAEGGPCGVLAAVQAQMIKEHMSRGARVTCLGGITGEDAKALLVRAIAAIIWRAGSATGGGSSAGLALPAGSGAVIWHQAASLEQMESLVRDALGNLGNRLGIVIVVMSLVLARGPKAVAKDMDDTGLSGSTGDGSLVGAHGYCTQELVNLLLCGRAVSNVFDGVKVLESDSANNEKNSSSSSSTELRGITSRADIGFLTLFEWYKYMEVGSYYKFPKFPVWVVCSESHFSTLFLHVDADADADATNQYAASTLDASSSPLRLAYYDGLASQEDEIVLTLRYDTDEGGHTGRREHAGLLNSSSSAADATAPAVPVPPLEYVIETRWPRVAVDWNDSEKIL